jgi:thioredoxin reductase
LLVADEHGVSSLRPRAVLLATGVRERPRAARLVAGDRGGGIFTTGSLQQLTAQHHQRPGSRAVVIGAEHVSFSAILTLRHAGCDVIAMVTPLRRHQTYAPLRVATATRHHVPIIIGCDVAEIHGRNHVEAVTLTNGQRLVCDTVVFTGDWIPDHELARRGGIEIDTAHRGPIVDGALRTNRAGVFAAGNLVHPAETADVCALDGRHVAASIVDWLTIDEWPSPQQRITVEDPIAWISPAQVQPLAGTPLNRFIIRVRRTLPATTTVSATQAGNVLWRGKPLGHLMPNRSISIPAKWLAKVERGGPDVVVSVDGFAAR